MNGIANHPIEPVQDEITQLRQRIAELENELSSQQLETEIADLQMLRAYNFLLSIYNVVPGLMLVVDDRGVIRQANAEAGRILGCNEQTLRGHLLTDFMAEPRQKCKPCYKILIIQLYAVRLSLIR